MRVIGASLMMASFATIATAQAAGPTKTQPEVLVELFTSEGCSSCPPADNWLQQIDISQPIAGTQVIVLSEHVDYWDHDGWKDPYSLAQFTDRQNAYVKALGISTPYTPQAIVNGKSELNFSEPKQINQVLMKEATTAQVPVSVSAFGVEGSDTPVLRAHIEVNGEQERRSADIFAAVALDHAESQVAHGENGGRLLKHVAVVQELVKVGKLEKGKVFSEDIQVKLRPNTDPRNLRLIVFVQEPDYGRVLGASGQKSSTTRRE
jgi:hypothetical protein